MKRFDVLEAQEKFDDLLEMSNNEAVAIEHDGNDIAILLSIEEYDRLLAQLSRKDVIETLHDESLQRYGKVYESLAKQPE